jgi:glycosyltransferase involved in cell wall biosynthesis
VTQTRIIHVISSMTRGGRERQLATIYSNGDKFRYPTKIVVFNRTRDDYITEYGIPDSDLLFLEAKKPVQRLKELIRIFREQKPDIVYAWGGFEASFCFMASPFSPGRFVNGSIRHGKVVFNSKHLWRLLILQLSRYIVANSRAGIKANRLHRGYVLYNGIDEKFIQNPSLQERVQARMQMIKGYKDQVILVSVANLVPFKDYTTTLNALGKLKGKGYSFYYLIIGDGPMRSHVEEQIGRLGLNGDVGILGKISNVKDYLQLADIFIHSSKGEGCSNAILEAMAAGLPIIASDTGGTHEITGEKNGRLFVYQDEAQLIRALEELMSDPDKRTTMGKTSFENIQRNFTIPTMVSNYYNIISQIAK